MKFLLWVLIAVIAYLLGNISTGLIVGKLFAHMDIRKTGSGNAGTTNVMRTLGWVPSVVTLLGDVVKAVLATLIGGWIDPEFGKFVAGVAVVAGHNWPVFFGFKGGKGVACSVAVLFLFFWQGLIAGAAAIFVIWKTRFISAGSMTMMVLFALLLVITEHFWPVCVWGIALAALCVYRHRANIQRLIKGTENKLSFKKKA